MKAAPIALISGANSKIGHLLAEWLRERGWQLFLHYHQNKEAIAGLGAAAQRIELINGDLSTPAGVKAFKVEVLQKLAGNKLNLLINNAAIYPSSTELAASGAYEENLATLVQLNSLTALDLTSHMPLAAGALVLNIGDARAKGPIKGFYEYGLTKNFLESATRHLALSMAPKVRVNMLSLGQVNINSPSLSQDNYAAAKTAAPLGYLPEIKDIIAATNFFLTMPAITGQILYLDGGRHLMGGKNG